MLCWKSPFYLYQEHQSIATFTGTSLNLSTLRVEKRLKKSLIHPLPPSFFSSRRYLVAFHPVISGRLESHTWSIHRANLAVDHHQDLRRHRSFLRTKDRYRLHIPFINPQFMPLKILKGWCWLLWQYLGLASWMLCFL